MCNELYGDRPLAQVFRDIAASGYEAVELAPYTLGKPVTEVSTSERERIRMLADDAGIGFTGLHWLLAKTDGLHVAAAEPAVRRRTLDHLIALSRLCADLGGSVLVFGSPGQRSTPPGMSRAEAAERALSLFREWAPHAEADGTIICLESLPAAETDYLNTIGEVIDLVEAIDSPAVQLVFDVKSASAEPTPVPELIRLAAPHLAYVQANDANRGGPGFGDTDFVPVFAALAEVGYDGYVSVEAFEAPTGIDDVAERSIEYLRRSSAAAAAL
ncbi:sugar phosphate isomerase/epimerase family protein [Leifsonia poae]|uniref:sugar phosphate isomerase/epimerase family protein n=1 Tax=Leifsonia poae TaxID=110933 RepID=UPI003D66C533